MFVSWAASSPNGSRFEFRLGRCTAVDRRRDEFSVQLRGSSIAGNYRGHQRRLQWIPNGNTVLVAFPAELAADQAMRHSSSGREVRVTSPTNSAEVGINTGRIRIPGRGHGIMNSAGPLIGLLDDVSIFHGLTGPDAASSTVWGASAALARSTGRSAIALSGSPRRQRPDRRQTVGKVTGFLHGRLAILGVGQRLHCPSMLLATASTAHSRAQLPALAALGLVAIALRQSAGVAAKRFESPRPRKRWGRRASEVGSIARSRSGSDAARWPPALKSLVRVLPRQELGDGPGP